MTDDKREPLYCWISLIGVFVNMIVSDGIISSYGFLYLEFLDLYRAGPFKTGWITTCYSLTILFTAPLVGWICDRFPVSWVVTAGALIGCVSLITCSLSASLPVTILTWGLGSGCSDILCYTGGFIGVTRMFTKNRPLALGVMFAGSTVGAMAFPPLTVWLINSFSARGTILIFSGLVLNMLISAVFLLGFEQRAGARPTKPEENLPQTINDEPEGKQVDLSTFHSCGGTDNPASDIQACETYNTTAPGDTTAGSLDVSDINIGDVQQKRSEKHKMCCHISNLRSFASVPFICIFFYYFGFCLAYYGFQIYMPPYAEELGMNKNQESLMLTLFGASNLCGLLVFSFISNLQCTNMYALLIFNMTTGAAMFIVFSIYPSFYILAGTMSSLGFFVGGSLPLLGDQVVDAVGTDQAGTGLGIINTAYGIALALYPTSIGALRQSFGSYAFASYVASGGLVLSVVSLFTGHRGRKCSQRTCVQSGCMKNVRTDPILEELPKNSVFYVYVDRKDYCVI